MIMKRIVLLIVCAVILATAAVSATAQSDITIEDASGWTIGKIRSNGDVEDASGWTIGRIRDNGSVEDASGWTIGRVRDNGAIEDASGWTIGRIRDNGAVEDASGWTIGRIGSGTIDSSTGMTALRFSGPNDYTRLGAYIFFFNKILKR
jgi:opacity protein-like surface antigen